MDIQTLLSHVDHTNLSRTASWEEIKNLCDDAMKYGCASVCIPPCYVNNASEYVDGRINVGTVVGFPNGYSESYIKIDETKFAILDGANEIDMVVNLCHLKDKRYDLILSEINEIKKACEGATLKVIIETCLLTNEEIVKMCEIVTKSKADYIKTSTGFSTQGATFEVVELIAKNIGENIKIKAAGGIGSLADAEKFIELGASRLGSSNMIKYMKKA